MVNFLLRFSIGQRYFVYLRRLARSSETLEFLVICSARAGWLSAAEFCAIRVLSKRLSLTADCIDGARRDTSLIVVANNRCERKIATRSSGRCRIIN
jgi:hypothetical protein